MIWNKNDDNENITISILSKKIIIVFIVKKNKIGTLQKDIICLYFQSKINQSSKKWFSCNNVESGTKTGDR